MVEEVMVCLYVSVASWCLERCGIHACNSESLVRRLTDVHCFLCIVCVSEILILATACFCDVWSMAIVAYKVINSNFSVFCYFKLSLVFCELL